MNRPVTRTAQELEDNLFLPDFCNVYIVFLGVILTELLAFVFVLIPLSKPEYGWYYARKDLITDLAMVSLFMQWVTLTSMGLLCLSRRWLSQLGNNISAGLLSYLLILTVTGFISESAYRFNEYIFFIEPAFTPSHHLFLLKNFAITAGIGALVLSYIYRWYPKYKVVIILSYATILIVTMIISEWVAVLQADPSRYPQVIQHQLFLWRNLGISAIISAIALRYFYIQHYWKQATEANAYARIQALQARIRPHFLFNSMNTIASLIRLQPDKAEQAVIDFADLFRKNLTDVKTGVTFQEELEWCQQYLRLEALRLEERLQVIWKVENIPTDAILPPLCLQPLLENAIYHGIQPLVEGGQINITGFYKDSLIQLIIENPLPNPPVVHQGHRMAQQNLSQRLHYFYGRRAQLKVQKYANTYQVSLIFPYHNQYDENTYR